MKKVDIVICGGSFVGLALARALTAQAPGCYSIALVEQRPLTDARQGAFDGRSAAITSSVKSMLETIGVWDRLKNGAEPIRRIELTDSSLDAPIRTSLLDLDADDAADGQPTAHIIENADLRQALFASLDGVADLAWHAPASVSSLTVDDEMAVVKLSSGETLQAHLVIAADGQKSALRDMARIGVTVWNSDKVGITGTVGVEYPHNGIARQHFLPSGPFAILPMTKNRVSVVWTEEAAIASAIFASGDERVLNELSLRFGPELGALTLLSKPAFYPLTMTLARAFVKPRFALAGDAAHGLHWIAGQGLNHGLKDVAALAETLIEASRLGLDIGQIDVLKRYERWRRFDSAVSAYTAAGLNRLFSNDSMALRMLRSSGLRLVDRMTRLKPVLMLEAAGRSGSLPKLLQGLPV